MDDNYTELKELLELTIKAGRRCAHDLKHATHEIYRNGDNEMYELFRNRADYWKTVFYPEDGPKNYRAGLHHEISDLEYKVEKLRQQLLDNGIEPCDNIPF